MWLKTSTWKLEALSPFFWSKRMSLWRYVSGWLYSHSCNWWIPRHVTTISLLKDGLEKRSPIIKDMGIIALFPPLALLHMSSEPCSQCCYRRVYVIPTTHNRLFTTLISKRSLKTNSCNLLLTPLWPQRATALTTLYGYAKFFSSCPNSVVITCTRWSLRRTAS